MRTMKSLSLLIFALSSLAAFGHASAGGGPQRGGEVCSNPVAPCTSSKYRFGDHELSFRLPRRPSAEHGAYVSVPFYALILKSVKALERENAVDCSFIPESERHRVQLAFPKNKVFTSRFQCPEQILLYTNTDQNYNFLAVYAGRTRRDAARLLSCSRASREYPGANIRRMQVAVSIE